MERQPKEALAREMLDNDNFVWSDFQGEVARIQVDNEGITFIVRKEVIPDLRKKLEEIKDMYPFQTIEPPSGETKVDKETFKMKPGYNWNCRKSDFITVVESWF